MSWTAHTDPDQIKERFDPDEVLRTKSTKLANWIRESKHCIFFTGAGISTSTGIPDFRGPSGVWTMRAMGKVAPSRTTAIKAIPSLSHMAIVELMRLGIVKYLVSQNTDGLHRKSNVPVERFAELHGNQNLEQCTKCGREYVRDFRTRTAIGVTDHLTGRRCDDPSCRGPLKDTIINFGESLPRMALMRSFEEAEKADLCAVLGSSLTVTPAADIPRRVAQRGQKLVIVNLQVTPLDPIATLKINGKTDDVMRIVMNHLNAPIPEFKLERRLLIGKDGNKIYLKSLDRDGLPFHYLRSVTCNNITLDKEPYIFEFPDSKQLTLNLQFYGHYNEPNLEMKHDFPADRATKCETTYKLSYSPFTREWTVTNET